MKIAAGTVPVIVLYVLLIWVPLETLQLWVAAATLPVVLAFIAFYIPERPWRQWFGTSLLLIAVAVLSWCLTIVLFRIFGDAYPGRALLVTSSAGLTFTAMVMRTAVLRTAQRADRK
ncbi:hypothetical protein [Aeromicrobium sp. UC242_57]|uniref:putative phage holin n=1 Tax=Aeromicrobium sp. UC242_57 TaxID=3374624 RepID=UPI003794BACF